MPRKKPAKPEVTPPPAPAGPAADPPSEEKAAQPPEAWNPEQPVVDEPEHPHKGRPSPLVDTRVIYCGDNLEQLKKLPDACIDLIYIDPPFNSNRNYEVFWGETREKRAFDDRHASTQAYIEFMRPRCLELARVLKKTGSFYYHCDWHAPLTILNHTADTERAFARHEAIPTRTFRQHL
ncbi:MAG: DNA methyltransferase [Planctomycetota bacterium]|nr:DNA methyltransferase [Planctomycetota bacterium]